MPVRVADVITTIRAMSSTKTQVTVVTSWAARAALAEVPMGTVRAPGGSGAMGMAARPTWGLVGLIARASVTSAKPWC
jgi:hypothetical protein